MSRQHHVIGKPMLFLIPQIVPSSKKSILPLFLGCVWLLPSLQSGGYKQI